MVELIQSKFGYEHWANARTLESLRTVTPPPEKALRWLGHIYLAHIFWFRRLKREPTPKVETMFPLHTMEELERQMADLKVMWQDTIANMTEDWLKEEISYLTNKGTPFTSNVRDILLHVANHSTYHRGQIAASVRENGSEPLATDYMIYTRGG